MCVFKFHTQEDRTHKCSMHSHFTWLWLHWAVLVNTQDRTREYYSVFFHFSRMYSEGGGGGGGGGNIFFIIIKMASVFKLPDVNVYVWGGGGRNNVFTLLKRLFKKKCSLYL